MFDLENDVIDYQNRGNRYFAVLSDKTLYEIPKEEYLYHQVVTTKAFVLTGIFKNLDSIKGIQTWRRSKDKIYLKFKNNSFELTIKEIK